MSALPEVTVNHKFSVAPMLDWTDKHCRYFHRQLSKHAVLYTEMVTTGAILFGQGDYLSFNEEEHPVVVQLGGSDPAAGSGDDGGPSGGNRGMCHVVFPPIGIAGQLIAKHRRPCRASLVADGGMGNVGRLQPGDLVGRRITRQHQRLSPHCR